MNDDFNASADSGDAFTAEEQAAFDAYASDDAAPEATGAVEPAAAADAAPDAAAAAAPPAEAAAPGDVVDPESEEGDADQNKGKFVRHGAFHQERERRKAVERELTELRDKHARADERLRLLTETGQGRPAPAAAAQAPVEPETPPDPNEDIFGYAKHLEKQIQDIRNGQTQMTEAQRQAQEVQAQEAQRGEVLNTYRGDVQRVMAAQPEFAQAYEHLFQGRIAELKVYGMSEADAVKAVRDDEFALVQSAIAAGQSPAERMLQLAKVRGFAPKPAEAAAPATPAETPAEKAARISRGQTASKSLSAAGGAPAGELTLEMLANMSEAEFEKVSAQNPARVRALMGG